MSRIIFEDGDILYADQVNQIAFPIQDGEDFIGRGPKVVDDHLDDAADQIKSRFYNFYDRLKLSHSAGLTFNYNSGIILLADGSLATISTGSIILPDASTTFVYVDNTGVVAQSNVLPNESFPIAKVTTAGGTVSLITDLRDKLVDRITPSNVPIVQVIPPGSGIEYWGNSLPSGWLWQDGTTYNTADYPNLFAAIGYTYGGSGLTFRVPDKRGRVGVGAGTGSGLSTRNIGEIVGVESVTLNIAQMPSHNHSVNDPGHGHGVSQAPHAHSVSDPGHIHSVYVNWTDGDAEARHRTDGLSKPNCAITGEDVGGKVYSTVTGSGVPMIGTSGSNIGIFGANANISINGAGTGISTNPQGGNQSHQNMQPSIVCNYIIKT